MASQSSSPSLRPSRPSFFRSLSSSSSIQTLAQAIAPRKDKPRLYLALYPRGGSNPTSSYSSSMTCDSYHWTLLIGPQSSARKEPGTLFQIVHDNPSTTANVQYSSFYEVTDLTEQSEAQSQALLARITLAKVLDEPQLRKILQSLPTSTPLWPKPSSQSDSEYDTDDLYGTCTCLTWVKNAYKLLTADTKCLRSYVGPEDWPELEEVARLYMRKKRGQGRFGGPGYGEAFRFWNAEMVPTWNFWENRETTV